VWRHCSACRNRLRPVLLWPRPRRCLNIVDLFSLTKLDKLDGSLSRLHSADDNAIQHPANLGTRTNIQKKKSRDARSTVTFRASEHYLSFTVTKLRCLVTESHVCERRIHGHTQPHSGWEPKPETYWMRVQCYNHYSIEHTLLIVIIAGCGKACVRTEKCRPKRFTCNRLQYCSRTLQKWVLCNIHVYRVMLHIWRQK